MAQDAAGVWVLNSGQWVRHNGQPVNPPPPPPPTGMRFAGDTQPLVTGQLVYGASVKGGASPAAWESTAGVVLGMRHRYWSGSDASALASGGPIRAAITEDHNAGRIPLVSWHLAGTQWGAAAGGTFDTQLASFFGDADERTKPVDMIVNHEPEGGNGNGLPDGNSTDYKAWMNHFKARLTAYRTANPSGRKSLVFNGCLMAATFTGSNGGISTWWPGDGVFDVLGIDGYAWDSSYSLPSGAMTKAFTYCAAHNQPFGISEYGVVPTDAQGGAKMKNLYNLMTSGSYDCVYMTYFSINGSAWGLNTSNGTLPEFYREMKAPSSVHFRDLGY